MLSYLTQLLGSITHYISVAGITVLSGATLNRLDLVKVDSFHVLLLIILEGGFVHHDVIRTEQEITQEELDDLSSYLNCKISGRSWFEARDVIREKMLRELIHYAEICLQTLDEVDLVLKKSRYRFLRVALATYCCCQTSGTWKNCAPCWFCSKTRKNLQESWKPVPLRSP